MSTMTAPAVAMPTPSTSTAKAANIANNNCANSGGSSGSSGNSGNSRNSRSGAGNAGSGTMSFYRVRQSWDKKKTQIAAFTKLENAKNCVDCNPGFAAFDEAGNQVYPKVCPKEAKQS